MIKLAIRDDDTNYFTKVSDLEKVYSEIANFPVSFAVIPTVTDVSTYGCCPETKGNKIPRFVGDNHELCDWLKMKVAYGKCDILMHGISHGYRIFSGGGTVSPKWNGEVSTPRWMN